MKFDSLKKKKDFTKTLKAGKRVYTASLTVVYLPSFKTRFAVCVGKKYGKSVQRNRIKRLLREAFRAQAEKLGRAYDILLLPRIAPEYRFQKFSKDLCSAISQFEDNS